MIFFSLYSRYYSIFQPTRDLGDVVIVDLEEKKFQSAHDDVSTLPPEVSGFLKTLLNGTADMGEYLARTFLRATVLLFGGYRMGFVRNEATGVRLYFNFLILHIFRW